METITDRLHREEVEAAELAAERLGEARELAREALQRLLTTPATFSGFMQGAQESPSAIMQKAIDAIEANLAEAERIADG